MTLGLSTALVFLKVFLICVGENRCICFRSGMRGFWRSSAGAWRGIWWTTGRGDGDGGGRRWSPGRQRRLRNVRHVVVETRDACELRHYPTHHSLSISARAATFYTDSTDSPLPLC